jgi:signal peptidase I
MTDDDRRDPADDDELADSLDLDDAAAAPLTARHAATPEPAAAPDDAVPSSGTPADDAAAIPPTGRRQTARKPHRKAPWWELPALVGLAIIIAILVKTFLVQPFYIPSESMEKTLHGCKGCSGDRILVSKIIYDFRDPHPGDIVVFNAPTGCDDEPPSVPPSNPILRVVRGFGQLVGFVPPDGLVLVKRVIAMGGQSVKGDADGNVFISEHGKSGPWRELHETYKYESGPDQRAKFGPVTVPKGRLWVMGDHRNASADYNSTCDVTSATVPLSAVIGKAFVIAWPPSRWTTLGTPSTFTAAADGVAGAGIVPLGVVSPLFLIARRRRRR